ncbi:hypothetical protein BH11BAC7_BH11BAC7_05700 [soil metagenome]
MKIVTRRVVTHIIPLLLFCAFLFPLCSPDKEVTGKIRLRWVKAYPAETWENVQTGIFWSLSYLGATLDSTYAKQIIQKEDSVYFTLDLVKAGFDQHALNAFTVIIDSLRKSEEYKKYHAIDLSRFLVLTEHSSWHYYEITGVAKTLSEFYKRHRATGDKEFHVYHSGVAKHQRNIRFVIGQGALDMAWIAEEGTGSLDSGTFTRKAYEVFDIMKNGQLRFAVYNEKGELLAGSPATHSAAGKPSKCIWCHELVVQPLFFETTEPVKGISVAAFGLLVDSTQRQLENYRAQLHSIIDFSKKQAHAQGELLYISFMEPSAFRLANEWGTDTLQIKSRMRKSTTHVYEEFPFLGASYYRKETDSLSDYSIVPVPLSVREPLPGEPNYFYSTLPAK